MATVDVWNNCQNDEDLELRAVPNCLEILQRQWQNPILKSGSYHSKARQEKLSSCVQGDML